MSRPPLSARTLLAAGAVLLLASAPALAQGCALCRQNLEQGGGEGLQRGFFWSIVLLVSLPFLLAGTIALLIRQAGRRARATERGT